jgi:hypothetical protein
MPDAPIQSSVYKTVQQENWRALNLCFSIGGGVHSLTPHGS